MLCFLLLWMLLPVSISAQDAPPASDNAWTRAATKLQQQKQQTIKDAQRTEEIIIQERLRLQQELSELKAESDRRERTFADLKKQFDQLMEQERTLSKELEEQREEIKIIEGTVKTAAKELESLLSEGFMLAEMPSVRDTIATLARAERFPGMAGIRSLVDVLMRTMGLSGIPTRRKGEFINSEGQVVSGEIMRIGMLTACYRTADGATGYLRPTPGGRLLAVKGKLSRGVAKNIDRYMDGQSDHLFLDLSRGAVFQRFAGRRSIAERLQSGGILVWPILLVGIVGLGLAVERLLFLRRIRSNTDSIIEKVTKMGAGQKWQECRSFCEQQVQVPVCRVLLSALQHLGTTRDVIEDALQEALLKELPRLERFIPTLGVLAAIAPLLGLLGTVTGMINTFHVITLFGTGDPRMMSGGISEALVTTQLGLAVAIPIMFMHHFLERRVDAIIGDMEEKGTAFAVTLVTNNGVNGKPA